MFHILGRIPKEHFYIACSGGKDSMVFLDFLRRYPKNNFTVLHFDHGTEHGTEANRFLSGFCKKNEIPLICGYITREKNPKESWEEYWRNERYKFFKRSYFSGQIITCHHLNDCVETWIFSSAHGKPKVIQYNNGKVIRPFLLISRKEIDRWAERNNVEYIEDPSNAETEHMRNFIRHEMVDRYKVINPGIEKTIAKIVRNNFSTTDGNIS